MKWRQGRRAQSTLEYAVLLAVVVAAILGIQVYSKRAVQGRLRQTADQIGAQWDAKQTKYEHEIKNEGKRQDTVSNIGELVSEITVDEIQSRQLIRSGEVVSQDADGKLDY